MRTHFQCQETILPSWAKLFPAMAALPAEVGSLDLRVSFSIQWTCIKCSVDSLDLRVSFFTGWACIKYLECRTHQLLKTGSKPASWLICFD